MSTPPSTGFAGQLGRFLWTRRKWWLGPILVLVVFTVGLLLLGAFTPLGAFIYTIF
ncbi:MAG: DUF5989 family protein [Candidatus Eisenbacteria bacterium]